MGTDGRGELMGNDGGVKQWWGVMEGSDGGGGNGAGPCRCS